MANARRSLTLGLVAAAMLLFTGVAGADTPEPDTDATTSATPSPEAPETEAPEEEGPEEEAPEEETPEDATPDENAPEEATPDQEASGSCWSGDATRDGRQGGNASCTPFVWGEHVRVIVRCDGFWPWSDYTRYGPWESRPSYSSEAYCDSGDDREWHSYESYIET